VVVVVVVVEAADVQGVENLRCEFPRSTHPRDSRESDGRRRSTLDSGV
jgi:hypothetical protein